MKFRHFLLSLVTCFGLSTALFAADAAPTMGIVNFATCITDSKHGKQEQAAFESLKKQMTTLVENTEKQLNELAAKFNDKEYLDSLSPEAEEEMKVKFKGLNEELGRYQNQYYQVLNQANMKLYQMMAGHINSASEKVAKEKKLNMIVNKEACFFYAPALEVTSLIIAEMDKNFAEQQAKKEGEVKKEAAAAPAPAQAAQPAAKTETKTK